MIMSQSVLHLQVQAVAMMRPAWDRPHGELDPDGMSEVPATPEWYS